MLKGVKASLSDQWVTRSWAGRPAPSGRWLLHKLHDQAGRGLGKWG